MDDTPKSPRGRDSRGDEARQKIRKVKSQPRTLSGLKSSKAIEVFVSERERERGL